MHLEEIVSSCNQAIALQMSKGSRPSVRRAAELNSWLLNHVCDCLDCLFAVMDPTTSLAESGCPTFQEILRQDGLLPLDPSTSPLAFAHVGDEMIENYCFSRLNDLDRRGFEGHLALCHDCSERLSSQREFMRVMKSALTEMESDHAFHTGSDEQEQAQPRTAKSQAKAMAAHA